MVSYYMPSVGTGMLHLVLSCYDYQYSIEVTLIRVASKNSVKNCYRASLKCQMMQETIHCMIYDVNNARQISIAKTMFSKQQQIDNIFEFSA